MQALRTVLAASVAALATSCAAPSLQGFEESELAPIDQRLLGEWRDPDDAHSPVFEVTPAEVGRTYQVLVTGHPRETEQQLAMVAGGILVGEQLVLDLTLAKEELEPIGEQYGLLLLPTHVFYRVDFEGEGLQLRQLDFDWLADVPGLTRVAEVPVFTGGSAELRRVFELALRDPKAWVEVGELQRAH